MMRIKKKPRWELNQRIYKQRLREKCREKARGEIERERGKSRVERLIKSVKIVLRIFNN